MKCSEVERTFEIIQDYEATQNAEETGSKFQLAPIFVTEISKHKDEIEFLHSQIHCAFCKARVVPPTKSMKCNIGTLHVIHRRQCYKFHNCFDFQTQKCRICHQVVTFSTESYERHFEKHDFQKLLAMPPRNDSIIVHAGDTGKHPALPALILPFWQQKILEDPIGNVKLMSI